MVTNTLTAPPKVNPFHYLSHPGSHEDLPPLPPHLAQIVAHDPIHVTKVTSHMVQLSTTENMQQPPPSPPITEPDESPTFGEQITAEPIEVPEMLPPTQRRVSNGSTGRPGSLAIVRSGRLAPPRDELQPPRISRRSTNPIPSPPPIRIPLQKSNSTLSRQTAIPGLEGPALDSDIVAQAEAIRRERLERRQKKAVEEREKEQKVLVGNLIGEDHVNYVLMYNMLTGIRIAVSKSYDTQLMQVSRCQAKIKRPVIEEDYTARHKYSFDM